MMDDSNHTAVNHISAGTGAQCDEIKLPLQRVDLHTSTDMMGKEGNRNKTESAKFMFYHMIPSELLTVIAEGKKQKHKDYDKHDDSYATSSWNKFQQQINDALLYHTREPGTQDHNRPTDKNWYGSHCKKNYLLFTRWLWFTIIVQYVASKVCSVFGPDQFNQRYEHCCSWWKYNEDGDGNGSRNVRTLRYHSYSYCATADPYNYEFCTEDVFLRWSIVYKTIEVCSIGILPAYVLGRVLHSKYGVRDSRNAWVQHVVPEMNRICLEESRTIFQDRFGYTVQYHDEEKCIILRPLQREYLPPLV
eukprot:CAMPEP_0195281632 /NCGR_PEP_ID=MMETSP0707-20130614/861_1 /TAXON_ID=33640 /ORGANISM="Asterionellopsis glacialis, Strain CCMP134" /LENGTH=303 /DNA_ID=CAMNT_0040340537 /DNA_START=85 /DNA_END=996 /DNA_ORIENTATION=+